MISETERAIAGGSGFLAGLDAARSAELVKLARVIEAAPDTQIFQQGDPPTRLLMVVAGTVKVWRLSPGGVPITVHMLGPGQLVGCMAVFCGFALPATATAVESSRLLAWQARDINALLARDPVLAGNAMTIVGARAARFLERIQDLSTADAETRIGRALLRLAGDSGATSLRVSRQELADLTATTLHTASRVVSGWEKQGLVRGGRRQVTILQPEIMSARFG